MSVAVVAVAIEDAIGGALRSFSQILTSELDIYS